MDTRFKIDFFELLFLTEACIPPRPIARSMFWDRLCDEFYHQLTENERERLYNAIKPKLDLTNEQSTYFVARFAADNQYIVNTLYEGKTEEHLTFKYFDKYQINKTQSVSPEFITKVEKINSIC